VLTKDKPSMFYGESIKRKKFRHIDIRSFSETKKTSGILRLVGILWAKLVGGKSKKRDPQPANPSSVKDISQGWALKDLKANIEFRY
jgi:hypothetical protein